MNVVDERPVASLVRHQTRRTPHDVVAFQLGHVVEPDAGGDQLLDVAGVQAVGVVAPAREVAVLRRRQLGADSGDVEAPRTVPPGHVRAAAAAAGEARRPRRHPSSVSAPRHRRVRLPPDNKRTSNSVK